MAVKGRPKADLIALDSSINNKLHQRGPVEILFHSPLKLNQNRPDVNNKLDRKRKIVFLVFSLAQPADDG